MIMLYQTVATSTVLQLKAELASALSGQELPRLERLLDLVVIKTLHKLIPSAKQPMGVQVIRADVTRLPAWLDQVAPSARTVLNEALTRTLLSLTVE